ncbi:MAG: hypothetical protein OQK98_11600 [Gammaproteobacteria bacterium]|nr:hypothetical protein [Gammaproteobacteria bacterium]
MELKYNKVPLSKLTTAYLSKFFRTKNLPLEEWEIITDGVSHKIDNHSVIKLILSADPKEQRMLADTLYELDSSNHDINGFLKHLAFETNCLGKNFSH